LLDFAAVGIEDAITEIGVWRLGTLDDEHLVAADAEAAIGERADLRRIERERRPRPVDDDAPSSDHFFSMT